ncbi:hypothetical protein BSP2_13910 [Bacillus subtilis subsp. subtilis]|nr:hypothetical protein BSP2_13910 [Bacillus subtilis subsp. subtilis]
MCANNFFLTSAYRDYSHLPNQADLSIWELFSVSIKEIFIKQKGLWRNCFYTS